MSQTLCLLLYNFPRLGFLIIQQSKYYFYPHSTKEETAAYTAKKPAKRHIGSEEES